MGADIHIQVEVREPTGKWRLVKPPIQRHDYLPYAIREWFGERQYALFELLSDVRYGLDEKPPEAPLVKGEWPPPGCSLTDTEKDYFTLTDEDRAEGVRYIREGVGDHSFGWTTLADLAAFDWEQPIKAHGDVAPASEFWPLFVKMVRVQLPALGYAPEDVRLLIGYDS